MDEAAVVRVGRHPKSVMRAAARLARLPDVRRVVVMPDAQPGSAGALACNGAAVATAERVYPELVGRDIGCGYGLVPFDGDPAVLVEPFLRALLERLKTAWPRSEAPAGWGEPSDARLARAGRREGLLQLGTLGRGNHFLELLGDEAGRVFALVHSGSRALGPRVLAHHAAGARGVGLPAEGEAGVRYLHDCAWARSYARLNRTRVLEMVAVPLSPMGFRACWTEHLDQDHNRLDREEVDGRWMWVHRKSVNRAWLGEAVVIAGTMSGPSFLAAGRGASRCLRSCAHGAGRRWSREEGRRRVDARRLAQEMRGVVFDARRSRAEAPEVYRDPEVVVKQQRELAVVRTRFWPLLNYRSG